MHVNSNNVVPCLHFYKQLHPHCLHHIYKKIDSATKAALSLLSTSEADFRCCFKQGTSLTEVVCHADV